MASIKIHQDVFGFERRRKGFTNRQITGFGIASVLAVSAMAVFWYALQLDVTTSITIATVASLPGLMIGFFPIEGMPAEEFVDRLANASARGNAITWEGEEIEFERGERTKEYVRETKRKGVELESFEEGPQGRE